MGVVIQISQLLLSLSLLIILHELGHFLFARLFKVRVEKFYLFFDPWFSLFKVKRGRYGIRTGLAAAGRICENIRYDG